MTQQELFQRLSGAIPTPMFLHLLNDVQLPLIAGNALDEVDWPGYVPSQVVLTSQVDLSVSSLVTFNGYADFQNNSSKPHEPVGAIALAIKDNSGQEYIIATRRLVTTLMVPQGLQRIQVSVFAQAWVGMA